MRHIRTKLSYIIISILSSFGKSVRIGLTSLVLTSPFVLVNKTNSEEYFAEGGIRYFLRDSSGYEFAKFNLGLRRDWKEGVEDDTLFSVPPPMGSYTKNVSIVEGKEVITQRMPAKDKPYNVSSSAYIVVPEGYTKNPLPNPPVYVTMSARVISGFEGWNWEVDEKIIEYPSGTYVGPTEIFIASNAKVNFTRDPNHPIWEPEPNEPEPEPPEPEPEPEKSMLKIESVHNNGLHSSDFTLMYRQGGTEMATDWRDEKYVPEGTPAIVSRVGDIYLKKDARPLKSKTPVYLEQMFPFDPQGAYLGKTNELLFSFPEPANEEFGNRKITFQEYVSDEGDPNIPDPNAGTFPVYDVRSLIQDGNGFGVVVLPDVGETNSVGHNFILQTNKTSIIDYNNDGKVDMNDFAIWAQDYKKSGNSQSDIASVDEDGNLHIGTRPDGNVDNYDLGAFAQEYLRAMKSKEETE